MKSYQWKTDTHVFETHVEDGHVILSSKSRISESASCKFLLSKDDADGLRDILSEAVLDIQYLSAHTELEEVPNV